MSVSGASMTQSGDQGYLQPAVSTGVKPDENSMQRTISGSFWAADAEKTTDSSACNHIADEELAASQARRAAFWGRYKTYMLAGIAIVILGWWISSTILKATRHRW